jgi:glucose-1-phosphate adenylyltransferase
LKAAGSIESASALSERRDNCDIGRRAQVRRAILDKNVRIPPDTKIGYDLDHDRQFHHVTTSGIVVVEGHRSLVDVASMLI